MSKKIVSIKGSSFHCNCGCGITYTREEFVDHYQKDVMPVSLVRFALSRDADELSRDVAAPQNLNIL